MAHTDLAHLFGTDQMKEIFPDFLSDRFFDALLGDPDEGAYDIALVFDKQEENALHFHFQLTSRPEKCLRCSLTNGLPDVFKRHPVINLKGVAEKMNHIIGDTEAIDHWVLGRTSEISRDLHIIPLTFFLKA